MVMQPLSMSLCFLLMVPLRVLMIPLPSLVEFQGHMQSKQCVECASN